MKFIIDFNREHDDTLLESLGAKLENRCSKDDPCDSYAININSFEELEEVLGKVDKEKGYFYSAVISFDPPSIYLDKEV